MVRKTILPNGVRVLTEEIPYVHSVSTGIWVGVGSRDEAPQERGITHFVEHMLFKGTQRRTALDIAKELDGVGGFANAFTSKEHVCFHAKVLDTHLPLVVDVLTDIFLHSVFASEEIEREQQVILQEIRMIEDTPDEYVHVLFQEMFWRDNPLGVPIYGTVEAVSGMDRLQLIDYLSRTFHPERIIVAAAGHLEHDRFVDLVASSLGTINHNRQRPARVTPQDHFFTQIIPKDLEQVHLCLGLQGSSQTDENRFACHLLNVILGNSMSSRLFQEVREKRGLAYSVYSFLNSHEDTGMLGVYAGISADKVTECVEVINEQLALLARQPITKDEITSAKEYLKGSMYLNAESTDSRMNRLAKNEFLFGRHIDFEEVEARINEVTPEAVQNWFQGTYQPEKCALLLFGPVESSAGSELGSLLATG